MRGSMSKQRYLLVVLLLGLCLGLKAEMQLESCGYSVLSRGTPIWMNLSDIDYSREIGSSFRVALSSRLRAEDKYEDQFPQKKQLLSSLQARYTKDNIFVEANYVNFIYGSSKAINLYPSWDLSAYNYERRHQHQANMQIGAKYHSLDIDAYFGGKLLMATPIRYEFDPITFEPLAIREDLASYEDIYTGMQVQFRPLPQLSLSALADVKEANFDTSDLYSYSSLGLAAASQLRVFTNGNLSGSAIWQNREGELLAKESRNLFTGQLRYQHKLGTQLYGYIGFISNSCADGNLEDFYLISNQVRTQLKYTAGYDPTQSSYLLAGAKYSPQHHANAWFSETQFKLVKGCYGMAGIKVQPDLPNHYQGRLSWYWNSASDIYLDYQNTQYEHGKRAKHNLGLGTQIIF